MLNELMCRHEEKWNLFKEDILIFCRERNLVFDLDEKEFIETIDSLIKEKHPDIVGIYEIQIIEFTEFLKNFEIFVSFDDIARSFNVILEKKKLSNN